MKNKSVQDDRKDSVIDAEFSLKQFLGLKINLELAGILFVNARLQIKEGEKLFSQFQSELEKYQVNYQKSLAKSSLDSDDFLSYNLKNLRELEVFYEPVVRLFSTAKILLVCCAETYINEVAGVVLKGRSLEEFDKLSIVGKWIFSQEILNFKQKLTVDRNPLQDFADLVKERNKIVHYKGKPKNIVSLEVPDYINDLKLSPKHCMKNIEAVKNLINKFSISWTGSNGPAWLNELESPSYRNPGFYYFNREIPLTAYSSRLDETRLK